MRKIAIVAVLLLLGVAPGWAEKTFTLNTADQPPYSTPDNTGLTDQIVIKAFQQLGVAVTINHLPSARSIENVELGIDDAEYARIAGFSEKYPNITMVDEELFAMKFTAFSKQADLALGSWDELKNYSVGHIRGWLIFENNIPAGTRTSVVASDAELFALLQNDRVDLVLYDELRGQIFLQDHGIKGIFPVQQPLVERGMHLYVNNKHKEMVPMINKALAGAKQ